MEEKGQFVSEEELVNLDLHASPETKENESTSSGSKTEVFTSEEDLSEKKEVEEESSDETKLDLPEGIDSVEQLVEEFNKAKERLENPQEDDKFKLTFNDISAEGLGIEEEDYSKAVESFQKTGKLSEQLYNELKEKYKKSDAEMKMQLSAVQSLLRQAEDEIWEVAGKEGKNIFSWAAGNIEPSLLERYNKAMSNPSSQDNLETAKLIVAAIRAKYEASVGVEKPLVTGNPTKKASETNKGYTSMEEWFKDQEKLKESYDPKLEAKMNEKLKNTTIDLGVDSEIIN